eukprot:CAMPEP_0201281936 /NCGR_PEP_ID=MMETSP1317-20130820/4455_1 /ASSEMBLY_ACC=CAM_ASM_000770 /TAXON_ID=187299 /ORGANISM="Undescribed Undescribed, Strain Undescribed" /LENGTH=67 /DNA_ID=CAMNT_0047593271 /DNA_START=481 /DNA_END=681 /DNA_ORIENTATION=+
MCAVVSAMQQHHLALEHAKNAMQAAKEALLHVTDQSGLLKAATILGVSYYNLGVETEFLAPSKCVSW